VFSLPEWVAAHAPAESAVGNKMVLDKGQLKVMVVWGPNERSDYHVEEGEVCVMGGLNGGRSGVWVVVFGRGWERGDVPFPCAT
jgi:hypothetical protein